MESELRVVTLSEDETLNASSADDAAREALLAVLLDALLGGS